VASKAADCRERIRAGEKVFLYEQLYVPVDSTVAEEKVTDSFSIGELKSLGYHGWKIVAVIPRTYGLALKNTGTTGTTWGAGLGGNVIGVYVVMAKELSSNNDISDEDLCGYFVRNLNDVLTREEDEILATLLRLTFE
jgi:hypothetical protein